MKAAIKRGLTGLGILNPVRESLFAVERFSRALSGYFTRDQNPNTKYDYVRPLVAAIEKRLDFETIVLISRDGTRPLSGALQHPALPVLCRLLRRTFCNPHYAYVISGDSVVVRFEDRYEYVWPLTNAWSLTGVPLLGGFEPVESAIVAALSTPGSTVVDIGANFGWHTVIMAHSVGASGSVHAFEPLAETFELLRADAELLPEPAIAVCNNVGLSDETGTIEMHVPVDGYGFNITMAASLERMTDFSETHRAMQARFITLDDYCETNAVRRLDFLKCDVEGAEMKVLLGGLHTIGEFHPTMLIEVQASCEHFGQTVESELDYIEDLGYEVWAVDDQGVRPRSDRGDAYNFLCIEPSRTADILRLLTPTDVRVSPALGRNRSADMRSQMPTSV